MRDMSCKSILVFLITNIAISSCRSYRFDYDYYPNVEGWLKYHTVPANWSDAFRRCNYEGAVLASPTRLSMKLAMNTHMIVKNKTGCPIFTGVHATFSRGDFFSIEGESILKMPVNWADSEPDNEDCIIFLDDGNIADVSCSEMFPYICFKKKDKNVVMTSCGTTDKDYELNPKNGNCYKFHRQRKSWEDAYMTCSAEGGYVAIINGDDEADYLWNLFQIYNKTYGDSNKLTRVGIYDWGWPSVRSDWRTIHGLTLEQTGYANWKKGFPHTKSSPCTLYDNVDKSLSTGLCTTPLPFVCEKSPDSLLYDSP